MVSRIGMHSRIALFAAVLVGGMCAYAYVAHADTLGSNLIANPSFESGTGSTPTDWLKGGYGNNTRVFTYPATPAHTGSRAVEVSITSYQSGDAKWYFAPVAIQGGGTYRFSDWYIASVPSEIDAQVTHTDGSVSYIVLGNQSPTSAYAEFAVTFTLPQDATKVTIFHVIDADGSLTVDDYSLDQITASSSGNLVQNGDFEMSGANGLPYGWLEGGYGSNTRAFSYPVPGVSGNGAEMSVSSYVSGDAKWYFAPINVSPGIYTYSDEYESNVSSVITVQLHHTDGSYTYENIAQPPASSSFTADSTDFVVTSDVTDVTVFHLLDQNGSLAIDDVSLTKYSGTGDFADGAVTLTFDNGWLSDYQNAVPKLMQDGFAGTFFIITHELSDYGYPGYVSKADIQQMYADGMEIGSHTQTHTDLTTETYAEQQQEIEGSRQDLLALNVGPIDSFAYPYGDYDATSTALVKAAGYTNARSTLDGYADPSSDIYHLPRFVVLNSTTPAQVESWIDEAAEDHVWLIIEFHQIDTSGDTYAMTPSDFDQVADYLKQKGIPVVTETQGVNEM